MFKDFVVKNFRCFSSLHLEGLSRVNLIAGKNNTGKTALLEAIHLHNNPTNCDLALTMNQRRAGLGTESPDFDMAGWLFYGKHSDVGLSVSSFDENGGSRTLSVSILPASESRERFPEVEKRLQSTFGVELAASDRPRLVMRYEQSNGQQDFSVAFAPIAGAATYAKSTARIGWNMPSAFIASSPTDRAQDVRLFGELEIAKCQDEILPALRVIEPRLKRLTLIPSGNATLIHGDIGMPVLLPVPLMGEGLRRLLSLLLAIATAKGGVVLIDEIENGFHYSVQKSVWEAIAAAARQNNVQIFATTHSWECIKAAHDAFKASRPYELAYHRLDRLDDKIVAKTFTEENLTRIESTDLEIR